MGRGGGILGHLPPAPPVSRRMVRGEKGEEIRKSLIDRETETAWGRRESGKGERFKTDTHVDKFWAGFARAAQGDRQTGAKGHVRGGAGVESQGEARRRPRYLGCLLWENGCLWGLQL